jgi:hypothetical protein
MKKVYFDKLDGRKNKLLAIPMILFLLIYVFTAFTNRDSNLHQISAIIGFGSAVIFFGKQFYYRNYVGWNKKGLLLRLNSFTSKNVPFHKIESYNISNGRLEIVRKDQKRLTFNLEGISDHEIKKIRDLLRKNTNTTNAYGQSLP